MSANLPDGGVDIDITFRKEQQDVFTPFMSTSLLEYNDEGSHYTFRAYSQHGNAYPALRTGEDFELILRDPNNHQNPFDVRNKRTGEIFYYYSIRHPYPSAKLPKVMLDPKKFVTGQTYTVPLAFNGGILEGRFINVEKQPDTQFDSDMYKLHFGNARVLKNGIYKPYLLMTENDGEQHFNIQNYITNLYNQKSKNYYSVVNDRIKSYALLGGVPISEGRKQAKEQHKAIVDSMGHYLIGKPTHDEQPAKRSRSSAMDLESEKLGKQIDSLPSEATELIAKYALPRPYNGYGGRTRRGSSKRTRQKRRHGRRRTYSRR
jgi:hypothetical protein